MRLPTPPASSTTATSAAAVGAALAAQRRGAIAGRGDRATKAPHVAMSSAKSLQSIIVTQIAASTKVHHLFTVLPSCPEVTISCVTMRLDADDAEAGAPPPMVLMQPLRRPHARRRGLGFVVAATLVFGYAATRAGVSSRARLSLASGVAAATRAVAGDALALAWDPACEETPAGACGSDAAPALQGFDVVEYFASDAAVQGSAAHSATAGGSLYYFSSAANRDAFAADPRAYAPQCGGFCAYGMSGADVDSHATVLCDLALDTVDTSVFKVDDGKLYLFKGASALEMMEGGDGFSANAAAAAAYYAELDLDPAFVNSNSKDCQSEVSMMWREVASSM